ATSLFVASRNEPLEYGVFDSPRATVAHAQRRKLPRTHEFRNLVNGQIEHFGGISEREESHGGARDGVGHVSIIRRTNAENEWRANLWKVFARAEHAPSR